MGIVTGDAFLSLQGGVYHRFVQSHLLFCVATIAHLVPLLFKYQLWNYSVPEVAFLTLLLLHNGMYTLHLEVFIGECLVTVQAILAHEPAPFRRGCTGRKVNSRAQEKYDSCCQVYTVSVQGDHFGSHNGKTLLKILSINLDRIVLSELICISLNSFSGFVFKNFLGDFLLYTVEGPWLCGDQMIYV